MIRSRISERDDRILGTQYGSYGKARNMADLGGAFFSASMTGSAPQGNYGVHHTLESKQANRFGAGTVDVITLLLCCVEVIVLVQTPPISKVRSYADC